MQHKRERERESFILRQRSPGVGIWRPPLRAACPSVCEASLKCRLVGLSIYLLYEMQHTIAEDKQCST